VLLRFTRQESIRHTRRLRGRSVSTPTHIQVSSTIQPFMYDNQLQLHTSPIRMTTHDATLCYNVSRCNSSVRNLLEFGAPSTPGTWKD
jgi:hypothetical protein